MKSQRPDGRAPAFFQWSAVLILLGILTLALIGIKHGSSGPVLQDFIGNMAKKLDLLSGMQVNLHKSAEAEKSAVMADTDEVSQEFAGRSRRAADFVERDRRELEVLLNQDHTDQELEQFAEFTGCWMELRKVDEVILQFAVQNTNLKAAALSFTEGRKAMDRLEHSLTDLIHESASGGHCSLLAPIAADALAAGLRIHNLHAPHIVESSDSKMDELEAEMHRAAGFIDAALRKLEESAYERERMLIEEARAAYGEFLEVNARVVGLSRRNTNVKSFELSLGKKRKIAAHCDEILVSLEEAVRSREFKATR